MRAHSSLVVVGAEPDPLPCSLWGGQRGLDDRDVMVGVVRQYPAAAPFGDELEQPTRVVSIVAVYEERVRGEAAEQLAWSLARFSFEEGACRVEVRAGSFGAAEFEERAAPSPTQRFACVAGWIAMQGQGPVDSVDDGARVVAGPFEVGQDLTGVEREL